jgi:hypothetical protein
VRSVVCESLWGTTASLGQAVARGLGPGTRTYSTTEITPAEVADQELLVLGAPRHTFGVPSLTALQVPRETMQDPSGRIGDVEAHLMVKWIRGMPPGTGRVALFEGRIPESEGQGGMTGMAELLTSLGYTVIAPLATFMFQQLPLGPESGARVRPESLAEAERWGAHLAVLLDELADDDGEDVGTPNPPSA